MNKTNLLSILLTMTMLTCANVDGVTQQVAGGILIVAACIAIFVFIPLPTDKSNATCDGRFIANILFDNYGRRTVLWRRNFHSHVTASVMAYRLVLKLSMLGRIDPDLRVRIEVIDPMKMADTSSSLKT